MNPHIVKFFAFTIKNSRNKVYKKPLKWQKACRIDTCAKRLLFKKDFSKNCGNKDGLGWVGKNDFPKKYGNKNRLDRVQS